jgi:AhpD family alkylhydroperoxidase
VPLARFAIPVSFGDYSLSPETNNQRAFRTIYVKSAFTKPEGVTHMFDMKNLTRLKKLDENAPDSMKAFWAFDKEAFKDGAIDVLHKQLMAVAVALTTQCPYCIELHVRAARQAGANDAMLTEAAVVAAAMRAGAAVTHASHLFKD